MPRYEFRPPEIQVVSHTLSEQIDAAEAAVIGARMSLYQCAATVVQIAAAPATVLVGRPRQLPGRAGTRTATLIPRRPKGRAHPERLQRRGLAAVHSALHMADTIGAGVGSLVGWAPPRGRSTSAACALRREFSASVMSFMRASSHASMDSYRV